MDKERCYRVVYGHWPPYSIYVGRNDLAGVMRTILTVLSQQVNFRYELVRTMDTGWGFKLRNGTWTGMVGMCHRGEVDVVLGPMGITGERASAVDMSIPLFHDQQVIAYSRPKLEPDLAGFVRPFTPMIWLLVGLTTALVFITSSVLLLTIRGWPSCRVSTGSAGTSGQAAGPLRDLDEGIPGGMLGTSGQATGSLRDVDRGIPRGMMGTSGQAAGSLRDLDGGIPRGMMGTSGQAAGSLRDVDKGIPRGMMGTSGQALGSLRDLDGGIPRGKMGTSGQAAGSLRDVDRGIPRGKMGTSGQAAGSLRDVDRGIPRGKMGTSGQAAGSLRDVDRGIPRGMMGTSGQAAGSLRDVDRGIPRGMMGTSGQAAGSLRDLDGRSAGSMSVTEEGAWQKINKVMLWTYGVMVAQSLRWRPISYTEKVLGCFWLLAAFIVSTVYTSNLMAMIIIPKVDISFSNLDELTEQTKIPYILMGGSVIYETMQAANKSSLFGRTWARKAGSIWTYIEGLRLILTAGYAIIVDQTTVLGILHNSFSKTTTCPLWMTREAIMSYMLSLGFNKNTSLKAHVDPVIRRLREGGLIDYWLRQQLRNSTHCLTPPGSEPIEQRSLQLRDFYGVFSLFGLGVGLSLAVFVLEVLQFRLCFWESPTAPSSAHTITPAHALPKAHAPITTSQ